MEKPNARHKSRIALNQIKGRKSVCRPATIKWLLKYLESKKELTDRTEFRRGLRGTGNYLSLYSSCGRAQRMLGEPKTCAIPCRVEAFYKMQILRVNKTLILLLLRAEESFYGPKRPRYSPD